MITQWIAPSASDCEMLHSCHYGRKILSLLLGYGTGYDFCRFFRMEAKGHFAWLMLQNSTMLICMQDDFPKDAETVKELSLFVEMHRPFRVEGSGKLLPILQLPSYRPLNRYVFRLTDGALSAQFDATSVNASPRLDDVYDILSEGFPNLIGYELWMADTSHMIRHGLRKLFTYQDMTTATAVYDIDDQVLIGQVATRVAGRGKGYARDFLHYLARKANQDGKTAILYALDIRKSYYEEISFPLIEQTKVWELRHPLGDEERKGLL